MASSVVPAVKAALETGLGALAALDGVLVSYGWPLNADDYSEMVVLGDAVSEQEAIKLGRLKRQEDVTQTVWVDVAHATRDQKSVTERAYAIAEAIEDYLRADTTLSADYAGEGQVMWAQFGGVPELRELVGTDGNRRGARLRCEINVMARI